MRVERDEFDGHLVLRFDFPIDKIHAEQVIDERAGTYTTWFHLHDDATAERLMEEIKVELMETLMVKLRTGRE